ncbi:hypothetical protein OESDEN_05293 [Oesophagostomum dentatum]|uniref:Tetratricopeptide repeat protein n=1 Tax=Oesophagostomum dentatum TaxID=61180 RepID=A0A0B1TG20_OESDE|nr:hypothetical protein OESDEN_05293 [Oesophagostomum dentatum]
MFQIVRTLCTNGMRASSSCSIMPSDTSTVVQVVGKLGRSSKQQCREVDLAAAFYKEGKRSSLKKLMKIVTKQKDMNEASSRCAAFAAALAVKVGKFSEAHEMIEHAPMTPPVIRRSLLINILTSEGRLDDAIDEMEKCLQEEDSVFNSDNSCISDEALDTLCNAIKAKDDTHQQMKRFRTIQRVLTDYNRRSTKSVEELLHTPLQAGHMDNGTHQPKSDVSLSDNIIGQVPHFLFGEK